MSAARVVVLADDLIWSDRLVRALESAGAETVRAREARDFADRLAGAEAAVVDLTARAYDGVDAVERAARAGLRVLAVGQHDDLELRKRALAAGAERVLAYRKLFESGPETLAAWLGAR